MSGLTFARWCAGEPRESRVFPPLAPDHLAARELCPACDGLLGNGTPVQLLAIGPSDDERRQQHRDGWWYSALALLFHATCLGTEVPE